MCDEASLVPSTGQCDEESNEPFVGEAEGAGMVSYIGEAKLRQAIKQVLREVKRDNRGHCHSNYTIFLQFETLMLILTLLL